MVLKTIPQYLFGTEHGFLKKKFFLMATFIFSEQ